MFRSSIGVNPTESCSTLGSENFTIPGVYSFTVPRGCSLDVSLAGAGGGNSTSGQGGGPGSLVSFNIPNNTFQNLTIVVGLGGTVANGSTYAGSEGGDYGQGGGGGGGSSYVISSATKVTEITGAGAPAEGNGSVSLSW